MLKNFLKKTVAIVTICLILGTITNNATQESITTSLDKSTIGTCTCYKAPFKDPNEWN